MHHVEVTGLKITVFHIFLGQFYTDFAHIFVFIMPVFLSSFHVNLAMFRSELRAPIHDHTHIHTDTIRQIIKRQKVLEQPP